MRVDNRCDHTVWFRDTDTMAATSLDHFPFRAAVVGAGERRLLKNEVVPVPERRLVGTMAISASEQEIGTTFDRPEARDGVIAVTVDGDLCQ